MTPEYSVRGNYGSYEPQGSEQGDYETPQYGYEGTIGYVHPDHFPHPPQVLTTPVVYHDHHTPPTYVPSIPNPSPFTPTPTPGMCDSPCSNQTGHVTTSKTHVSRRRPRACTATVNPHPHPATTRT
jgi:hypothetical protein